MRDFGSRVHEVLEQRLVRLDGQRGVARYIKLLQLPWEVVEQVVKALVVQLRVLEREPL